MYEQDFALDNLQGLICHKSQSNQIIYITYLGSSVESTEKDRQIHVPRKQRRINRKGHRNEVNESMDSYQ